MGSKKLKRDSSKSDASKPRSVLYAMMPSCSRPFLDQILERWNKQSSRSTSTHDDGDGYESDIEQYETAEMFTVLPTKTIVHLRDMKGVSRFELQHLVAVNVA